MVFMWPGEIPESDLAETVENIRRYDMFGINLSMPYKEAVIPFWMRLVLQLN